MPTAAQITRHHDGAPPDGQDPFVVHRPVAPIAVVDYDPEWPSVFTGLESRIRTALGARAIRVEHIGSTSVPGLPAKPAIDIDLMVANPNDESAWLPPLQRAGFVLMVREPWWQGHRCLSGGVLPDGSPAPPTRIGAEPGTGTTGRLGIPAQPGIPADGQACVNTGLPAASNIHVFGPDAPEPIRHVIFRDWLRANAGDRALYARAKREAATAASAAGEAVMDYNARKESVLREIYDHAFRAAGLLA